MKRKFTIILEVTDDEGPEDSPIRAASALREYLIDQLGHVCFDIHKIEVTCE